MLEIFNDTGAWLILSFVLFLSIVWKFGKPQLISMLDTRIESIREEIKVAGNLRIEAQEMLAQYQRKHRDALQESEKIIKKAEQQAEDIRKRTQAELEESVALREKQLDERLERMKQNVKEEIRQYAASLAMAVTQEIVVANLNDKTKDALVDQSIKNIAKNAH